MARNVKRLTTREEIFRHLQDHLADMPGFSIGGRDALADGLTNRVLYQISENIFPGGVPADSAALNIRGMMEALYARYRSQNILPGDVVCLLKKDTNIFNCTPQDLLQRIDLISNFMMRGYFSALPTGRPKTEASALREIFCNGAGGFLLRLDTRSIYRAALCEHLHPGIRKSRLQRMGVKRWHRANLEKLAKIAPSQWPDLAKLAGYEPLGVPAVGPKPARPAKRPLNPALEIVRQRRRDAAAKAAPAQG